jgi:hypothetical protein
MAGDGEKWKAAGLPHSKTWRGPEDPGLIVSVAIDLGRGQSYTRGDRGWKSLASQPQSPPVA